MIHQPLSAALTQKTGRICASRPYLVKAGGTLALVPVWPVRHSSGRLRAKPKAIHADEKPCRLKRSTQHLLAVYLQESGSPMPFWDIDSSAARPGRAVGAAKSLTIKLCLQLLDNRVLREIHVMDKRE